MSMAIGNVTTAGTPYKENKKIAYPKTFVGTAIGVCVGLASTRGFSAKNNSLLYKGASVLMMALPGITIDYFTNRKRKRFAAKTEGMSERDALRQDRNAYVTKKLNPYVKTNTGKVLGTLFGVAYLSLSTLSGKGSAKNIGIYSACGAACGFVLGFLTDYLSNWLVKGQVDRMNRKKI